ncbi:MAG: family 78 glycoside hydrolase catalytic domain [Bacteroidales bacterium]|nr:family 78 glycoside hydrolase catalytic domain [Bacteroidales bacterium]
MKYRPVFLPVVMLALLFVSSFRLAGENPVGKRVAALPDEAWERSQWISAVDAPVMTETVTDKNCKSADGASWFVSTVKNEKKVVSAKWMTAGLGVYYLYLNGQPVGKEVLKPGFTHYAKTKRSFTYDITDAFRTRPGAKNQLSAQVTPGWWADKIITPAKHQGMIGKKCAFRGVLELTYADGSKKYYGTGTGTWKAGIAGPVKHAGIFDGERYDARELPGYAVADKLAAPELNTEFQGEVLPSEGAEIYLRKDIALAPVEAYVWQGVTGEADDAFGTVSIKRRYSFGAAEMRLQPGETLVVDFGQNCSAVPSFVFKAAEGTQLTCLPSEILNDGNGARSRGMDGPEGSCHRLNLRIPDEIRIDYTFAGTQDFAAYQPQCSFFGYRYLSITATSEVVFKSINSIPVTSIAKELETGVITTGNDLVNKLISNTVWGQRSNYLSVPTDCPQRNERLGWTADTQVFAETGSFFADTRLFFHKWMRDMRDSQSPTGSFPAVAPLAQYGNDMMRLGWADAGVIVPWTVWKQFGDTDIIAENWEAMERYMDHVNETKYSHTALMSENGNYQYADWLSYEPFESHSGKWSTRNAEGKRVALPEAIAYWNYLGASYWAIDAALMSDMAAATGRDASRYERMAEEAREYLRREFLTKDGRFKTDILNTMQTPALFALKNNLVEGKAKEGMVARLRKNFEDHGQCLQTGFLGTSILMETLTENGMVDIAYDLLFQRSNPSWLYSVDNGATTIWERWNSYTLENGMGPKGMNSFNHYAYGCVCAWLWKTAAGIAADPAAPGFKRIIMTPIPDKRLGSVTAEYNSAAGPIRSSWTFYGNKWVWEFSVPKGARAVVRIPNDGSVREYPAGDYSIWRILD